MKRLVKEYLLKDFYGDDYMLAPYVDTYKNNSSLAILLYGDDDELFCGMTVNLTAYITSGNNCAFVDTNNNPWIIDFINTYKLGKPTGRVGRSGYCEYPEYEFDLSKMNEGQPEY